MGGSFIFAVFTLEAYIIHKSNIETYSLDFDIICFLCCSAMEQDVFIGIKYIAPSNGSNITDWLSTTTPAPVRKRREAATSQYPQILPNNIIIICQLIHVHTSIVATT